MTERTPFFTDPTGQVHKLRGDKITIGRAVESDIMITSRRVSREHACVRRDGWRTILEDLGSTNGTFLNDEHLLTPTPLQDEDRVKIGDVVLVFHDPDVTFRDNALPELEIDASAGVARVDRQIVTLSPKEFALLTYLASRANEVCSKDEIAAVVWSEYQDGVYDYQVENLVSRLRAKLERDSADPQLVLTVRGMGYKLVMRE